MSRPDRDTLRMVFGFSPLIIMAALASAIALGHVEEKTSYGLMPLLTTLSTRVALQCISMTPYPHNAT